ncbi:nuclear transport factor 2 family protein [Zobellia sp. B3R18]|uniref:nuclear transport factor 2 family protein n=1 Tax=Zobellia sp. B3R18 TaxID=2841568 RepID=UPI001C07D018|nr:nuclear transport factor 2 family protein [Zobellia sp. B3R18]MBU2973447.1 nuclear transport factor 2 family protein [Zobellia sp. B3R18]
MKNTLLSTVLVSALSLSSCNAQDDDTSTEVSNEEKVIQLLKSIETGAQEPAAYINPYNYVQHNLEVADGIAGFIATLQALPPNSAKVNTVRTFEDGDYIFTHTDYNFFGPKIGFDVFRFENGLIVEHWNNLQVTPEQPNPSGHTMIDGTTEITDLDKTEENKTLVRNFITDILINGNMDKIGNYFEGDQYIQHNPSIADGLSGLGSALAAMAEQGVTMEFSVIHKVLGQGNFVLSISEGHFGGAHTSYYDLFRVENGKIAEHWDVIETIAPEADRKNTNGKFNFPN